MSKMLIEFDTVSKELVATIDGAAVSNVVGVSINPSWDDEDEYQCMVTTKSEDETTNIKTLTMMYASECKAGQALLKKAESVKFEQFPGFVGEKSEQLSKAQADILKHFAR